jgi:hypothetical protein
MYLIERRLRLIQEVNRGAHNDIPAVISEEAAIQVQVFTIGYYFGTMKQDKKAFKELVPDVDCPLVIAIGQGLPLTSLK